MASTLPIFGVITFAAFLVFAVLTRVGATQSPYRSLARSHFAFSIVYLAGASLSYVGKFPIRGASPFSWESALLGFYIYFALEYAFFAHVFATIIRGFSINLCVSLYRLGGEASLFQLQSDYADGKGMAYVKKERIEVLIQSGAIENRDGNLRITEFGKRTAMLNRYILKVWNLGYLGMNSGAGK